MDHTKFEAIISGKPQPLTLVELDSFKVYCSSRSLSLQQWIDISITLYKIDRQLCFQFLLYVQKHEINRSIFKDYIHQNAKIKIYNSLASITMNKAAQQTSKEQTQKYMNQTIKYINSGEKIKMIIEKNIIRPYLLYYTGEIIKASTSLNKLYDQSINANQKQPSSEAIVVILGLAQNSFIKKNYQKALQLYKKALEIKKSLPSKARIGMAYCFYYLEKYELAQLAFKRIISIDPKNVEAYIGLAVISDKKDDYNSYFNYLVQGFKVNPKHPLLLLHLAQHFLLKGQLEKTIKFCQDGLRQVQKLPKFTKLQDKFRNDYEEFKARFNNILGQVYHIENKYQNAIKYYLAAKDKGLNYNCIFLSQVYMYPNYQNYVEAEKVLEQLYLNASPKILKILGQSHKLMAYLKTKTAGRPNQEKGSNYYYKQALKFNKNDAQLYIQYSNILFEVQKKKALEQLYKAKTILQQKNKEIRPQLYNNCAVLQLQLMQYEKSGKLLQKCIQSIQKTSLVSQQQQIKNQTLLLTAMFNLGIVKEKLSKLNEAIELYDKIIEKNKFFVDAYIRCANILASLGRIQEAIDKLDRGLLQCQASRCRFLRNDKFINMKAHILHKMGSENRAKQAIKLLSKTKDMYTIFYELCIDYQMIMKKQTQAEVLKDFLRPKRQMCIKFCQGDHNSIFSYLVLVVLLLTGKKITKNQAVDYFSLLKDGQQQLPTILYNMGIFFFNYQDNQNALLYLNRYRQKTYNSNIDEMIALILLLNNKYDECIRLIKKNILRDPKNLKYRFQLVYASEKKSQFLLSSHQKNAEQIKSSYKMLQKCYQYFMFLYKINPNDYTKGQSNPDLKDKIKAKYIKIKQLCQDQRHYTQSKIQYYDKARKEVELKERQEQEMKKRSQKPQDNLFGDRNILLSHLMEDEQDDEKQRRRQQQQKKQKILALMKQKEQKLNDQLRQMQQQRRIQVQEKKSRRIANPKKTKKRNPKPKEQQYDFLDQNQQQPEQQSYEQEQTPQALKHRKHHQGHDRKKLKKKAYSSEEQMDEEEIEYEQQQQQVQAPKKKKKMSQDNEEDNQESDLLKKYMVEDNQ